MRFGWLAVVGCAVLPACVPYAETSGGGYAYSYGASAPVYPYAGEVPAYPYGVYGGAVAPVPVFVPERRFDYERRRGDYDRGRREYEGGYRPERFVPRERVEPGRAFGGQPSWERGRSQAPVAVGPNPQAAARPAEQPRRPPTNEPGVDPFHH